MDQIGDNNDDTNWLDEILLREEIKNLSPREKRILTLRFMQGKTQMEVAQEVGISQAQVSRLEKGAMNKIKNHWEEAAFFRNAAFCFFDVWMLHEYLSLKLCKKQIYCLETKFENPIRIIFWKNYFLKSIAI